MLAAGSGHATGRRSLPRVPAKRVDGRIPLRRRSPAAEFFRTPAMPPPLTEEDCLILASHPGERSWHGQLIRTSVSHYHLGGVTRRRGGGRYRRLPAAAGAIGSGHPAGVRP